MANLKSLRELATEHALGNLDKESYRKSRAELIQGILSATIPLKEIEYPPPVQPPAPEALDDTQRRDDRKKPPLKNAQLQADTSAGTGTASASNAAADPDGHGSNKVLFIGLAAAVAAIIIVALIVLLGGGSAKQLPSTMTGAENSGDLAAVPQTKTQAQSLIQSFLNKNNWSSSSLDNFLRQWNDLPAGDMLASKDSLEMGQITNAIYKQLLEERALSGLVDDDSSLIKQRQLLQFANELGIDDPRITLPEELDVMENMTP